MKWHCPPNTGSEFRALVVWSRARYLPVPDAPHNIGSFCVSGEETFRFFETWRPWWGSNPRSPTCLYCLWLIKHYVYLSVKQAACDVKKIFISKNSSFRSAYNYWIHRVLWFFYGIDNDNNIMFVSAAWGNCRIFNMSTDKNYAKTTSYEILLASKIPMSGSILGHRIRRWPNVETTLGECILRLIVRHQVARRHHSCANYFPSSPTIPHMARFLPGDCAWAGKQGDDLASPESRPWRDLLQGLDAHTGTRVDKRRTADSWRAILPMCRLISQANILTKWLGILPWILF